MDKLELGLSQLRDVHAVQGRDGCWDIDDYMLGLYNGLELALSLMEQREVNYKDRPVRVHPHVDANDTSEERVNETPKNEHEDWLKTNNDACRILRQVHDMLAIQSVPMKRAWQDLTEEDFSCVNQLCETPIQGAEYAAHLLKEKNGPIVVTKEEGPVQVSIAEFMMRAEQDPDLVGRPVIWTQWPKEET